MMGFFTIMWKALKSDLSDNRGNAYVAKGEYDKAREDVHKAQSLGFQLDPEFLKPLRPSCSFRKRTMNLYGRSTSHESP